MAMNIRSVKNRLAELVSGVEEMVEAKQDLADECEAPSRAEKLQEKADMLREILDLLEQAQGLAEDFVG